MEDFSETRIERFVLVLISRPALVDLLRTGATCELTLLSAPTVYSKTTLKGSLDQPQPHSVLQRIQDFDLQIIEVEQVSEVASAEHHVETKE